MSRYQWPSPGFREDRALRRLRHQGHVRGFVPETAAAAAHAMRSAPSPAMPAPPADAPNLWLPIGPTTVISGQAGSNPRVSGRVRDVAVSPDGQRAYAATASGGVWYSGDAGTSWSPLGNWAPTPGAATLARAANALNCGCLLVEFGAPADGSADVVYVGTGETRPLRQGHPGSQLGGVGVLRLSMPLPQALAQPFANPWQREAANLAGTGIYRLAWHPTDHDHIAAATSMGLFTRKGPFVENDPWTKITTGPFDFDADDEEWVTDVAWAGGRLWVALEDHTWFSDTGVWMSNNRTDGPFHKISLDGVDENGRLGIAVAPSDPTILYVLGKGARLWRITGVTSAKVGHVPKHLFGEDADYSHYDLALAVHPTDPARIILGGHSLNADGEWSASLFRCDVVDTGAGGLQLSFAEANQNAPVNDATYIGSGVHADVHAVHFVSAPGGVEVWVGCDGGVFRSRAGGDRHTFVPCNTGLAVLECGYVASHPTSDALVLAGTQDNGVLIRIGDTLWQHWRAGGGDGGGVVFHPIKPSYFAAQYKQAGWSSNGLLTAPVLRNPKASRLDAEKAEEAAALFYSGCDVRRVGATNQVRLALGTHRVWVADNWDPAPPPLPPAAPAPTTTWMTLPSRSDPRASSDTKKDTYEGADGIVVACRWGTDDRLYVLGMRAVFLFTRRADGTWDRKVISHHTKKCTTYKNDEIPQPTSPYLPPLGPWSDLAVHDAGRPPDGSFYVAAGGIVTIDDNTFTEADRMDTVWWYDGAGTWHPAGLRGAATGTKVPAYAIVCDPDDRNVVYVGTALGVWRGVLTMVTGPVWSWEPVANGLPEAAVQDLSFHTRGAVKILRAAVQARGVWEVDLSAPPFPRRRTYLRVHPYDTRRAMPVALDNPTPSGGVDSTAPFPWHASPDIRLRPAPLPAGGTAPLWPGGDTWKGRSTAPYFLWVFQTALHRLDPLCRATGDWTAQFEACLRRHDPAAGNTISAARWASVVTAANVYAPPWNGSEPTEADLDELIFERGYYPMGLPSPLATQIPPVFFTERAAYRVDVLVHHRDSRPIAASDVRVTLLRRLLPANPPGWGGIAISAPWKARVQQLVTGTLVPPGFALPDGWVVADPVGTRQPTMPVDARLPRVVTFDVNFSAAAAGSAWVLLAIVHATSDPVTAAGLTGATLEDLVRGSHHVAARAARVP